MKNKACFRIFVLAALLYAAFAAAPPAAQYQGFSLGLGVEGNGITIVEGLGLGGQFAAEARLSRRFALDFHLGVSTFFSQGLDAAYSFIATEALLYPRWYFFTPEDAAASGVELFAGAGAGVLATVSDMDFRESRGSPKVGVIAGARFRLTRGFYVEPYVRAGYPNLVSLGIMAGLRFPARGTAAGRPVVETVVVERPVTAADTVLGVYFPPDETRFDRLDGAVKARNMEALEGIVRLPGENPSVRLLLEGHANPAYGTEQQLMRLGNQRAAYVEQALVARGVSPDRLITADWGGRNLAVPPEDRERGGQNRRVDMRLLF
jgi:outer membrane protein OmpA-like peptidoglycan-associated protein